MKLNKIFTSLFSQIPNMTLTMPTHENGGFNSSNMSSAAAMTTVALSSSSQSLLPSTTMSANTPPVSSSATLSATAPTSALAASTPSGATTSSSSLTTDTVNNSIPAALSSFTCLHHKRFMDSQQSHAQPMDTLMLNKDRNDLFLESDDYQDIAEIRVYLK
uniref:Uncharacterized protein n=1 Tax=Glossina pallidipes TaxID=7398 RepID=A0A1B0A8Z7_GLOPL